MKNPASLVISLVVVLLLLALSVYSVDQRQAAMVFQLGEVVGIKKEPGLYLKMPFLQNIRYFDTRILTLDAVDPERFITSEKKNVLVDYYVKWRVIDVQKFYVSFSGDERRAGNRLAQTVNDGMRAEFGKRTVHDVVSGERDDVMEALRKSADADARRYGVEVMDVRIKRVDLPTEVSESVYRRMDAERKRVANELRSTGGAEAEKIKADADRQREVIIAEAYREAQKTKGEGDAKAAGIYGAAFGKNPEFYAFYRSMESYKQSFRSKTDVMVLQPNSEFFRYMKSPRGGGK
ncbi:MAG: protease modulator HflC [Betaproteobacteria bacterium]|nr:protease modulator HflC [Betaproteobacteria bacterium]